jgi:hypothetical protein
MERVGEVSAVAGLDLTHSFDLNGYRASATSRGAAAQGTLSYSPYQI